MKAQRALMLSTALLVPLDSGAQTVSSFSDLPLRLDLGDTATVRNAQGARWRGRLLSLTPAEIVLRVDEQPVRFRAADVHEVAAAGDSLLNGTLIGCGIGAFLGIMAFKDFSDHSGAGDAAAGGLLMGGIGAGLGLAADAIFRGSHVIYRQEPRVSVTPIIRPGRAYGVNVTLRR